MEINISLSDDYYYLEERFFRKCKEIIQKRFEKKNMDRCDINIYYSQKKYKKIRECEIIAYKFSKKGKGILVEEYDTKLKLKYKIFYPKNEKNYIITDFNSQEEMQSKRFIINNKVTREICYNSKTEYEIIEYNRNKNIETKPYKERTKIFLKKENEEQYNLIRVLFCDGTGDDYIEANKNGKQIRKFYVRYLGNDFLTHFRISYLRNKGEVYDILGRKGIINFKNFNFTSYEEMERDAYIREIRKEIKEREERKEREKKAEEERKIEFQNGYHTRVLDINFVDDKRKQFVNGHKVKKIYDYEFKVFIDEEDRYRTLTGDLISHIDLYLKKCYKNKGMEYEIKENEEKSNNYEDDYSTESYVDEVFDGDMEAWEDYCEDISERY